MQACKAWSEGLIIQDRSARDAIYEETEDLSREELKQYFAREAAAMRQESQGL